jgi:uncharacterized membrane protein
MRTTILAAIAVSAGVLAATSLANAAAYTYTQIDVPGAVQTIANAINNAEQIVGTSFGTTGGGFLYQGGNFAPINVPGFSQAQGINDAAQIVGSFIDSTGTHGFLDTGGNFTQLDVPGATSTDANGINSAGQIVGTFLDSTGTVRHGFLDTGSNFATIDVPGATETQAFGINNVGQIVGLFFDSTGQHGFLDTGGIFTTIDVPGASSLCFESSCTIALGINDAGQIVGRFGLFINGTVRGFLDTDGTITPIDAPATIMGGLPGTVASGINDMGQIVGSTGLHGFLATPISEVPEPSSLALVGVGVIALGIVRRRQRA